MEYIQVGVTALRAPDGTFLPAVPLYVQTKDQARLGGEETINGIAKVFAQRMKQYVDEAKKER